MFHRFLLFETYAFEFRTILFHIHKAASFSVAFYELLSHWVVGLAASFHSAYAMTISDRVILCPIKHLLFGNYLLSIIPTVMESVKTINIYNFTSHQTGHIYKGFVIASAFETH